MDHLLAAARLLQKATRLSRHCRCKHYSFPHRHGSGKCQSGKSEGVERLGKGEHDQLHEALAQHFGTTRDHRETGYVLPDGRMLDLSGRHYASGYVHEGGKHYPAPGQPDYLRGNRVVDHRELPDLPELHSDEYSGGLRAVMNSGVVRNMPGVGFGVSRMPTDQQITAIVTGHRRHYPGDSLMVDLDNEKGDTVDSHEFLRPTVQGVKQKLLQHFSRLAKAATDDPFWTLDQQARFVAGHPNRAAADMAAKKNGHSVVVNRAYKAPAPQKRKTQPQPTAAPPSPKSTSSEPPGLGELVLEAKQRQKDAVPPSFAQQLRTPDHGSPGWARDVPLLAQPKPLWHGPWDD